MEVRDTRLPQPPVAIRPSMYISIRCTEDRCRSQYVHTVTFKEHPSLPAAPKIDVVPHIYVQTVTFNKHQARHGGIYRKAKASPLTNPSADRTAVSTKIRQRAPARSGGNAISANNALSALLPRRAESTESTTQDNTPPGPMIRGQVPDSKETKGGSTLNFSFNFNFNACLLYR